MSSSSLSRTSYRSPSHLKQGKRMQIEVTLLTLIISLLQSMIDCRSMKHEIGKMRFKPCSIAGYGAVKWVKISPCDQDPCIFKPMTDVTITVSAIAPKDIRSAKLQAYLEGMSRPFPGFTMDICEQTRCPIRKGTPFQLSHTVKIPIVPTKVSVNGVSIDIILIHGNLIR